MLPASSSVLAYARDPDSKRVMCLLWKDAKATKYQSAQFFGSVVCEREAEDEGEPDTVARAFSWKTGGIFAAQLKDAKKAANESKVARIHRAHRSLLKRVGNLASLPKGHLVFTLGDIWVFMVPVLHHSQQAVNDACGTAGVAVWVDMETFLHAMADDTVTSVDLAVKVPTSASMSTTELKLYLSFTAVIRRRSHLLQIYEVLSKHLSSDLKSRIDFFEENTPTLLQKQADISEGKDNPNTISASTGLDEKHQASSSSLSPSPSAACSSSSSYYACRQCRRMICRESDVIPHEPSSEVEMSFYYKNRNSGKGRTALEPTERCSSLFVRAEVLQAFISRSKQEGSAGDIACVHCNAHVGKFNWSGSQCSCGAWQTPSMQVLKRKVDLREVKRSVQTLLGMVPPSESNPIISPPMLN